MIETDPDNSGNHVLHVISSGPQEHMNNHIETTLGRSVTNGLLYEISFRARWITGNHLLNTRLYFNRVARTTALPFPQLNGTPGAVNSVNATNIGPTFSLFQHQPVVPQPGQPVTVFVRAQDAQGVSACAVWWSVNGGAWSNAPMTAVNGAYSGTIPKQPTGSLVQLRRALRRIVPGMFTRFHDAMLLASRDQPPRQNARHAIIVLTDGIDSGRGITHRDGSDYQGQHSFDGAGTDEPVVGGGDV